MKLKESVFGFILGGKESVKQKKNMKATSDEIAEILDEEIKSIKRQIESLTSRVQFICQHHWRICKIGVKPTVGWCNIEFQGCERDEVFAVMKAFGGKWEKSPHYSGKGIDYRQYTEDYKHAVVISNAKPPASCKVVEEEVDVPATPARKEKRFKLECIKPVEGETTLPVPDVREVRSVDEVAPELEPEVD